MKYEIIYTDDYALIVSDEQIEDVIFSVLYKNASSTRRINKLKKS